MSRNDEVAFPRLSEAELAILKDLATPEEYLDKAIVFPAGRADIDLYRHREGKGAVSGLARAQ
jgi:hypothetical protein